MILKVLSTESSVYSLSVFETQKRHDLDPFKKWNFISDHASRGFSVK